MNNEYLKRNALGFEGDTSLKSQIENIINDFDIDYVIETGTFMGASTKQFANMVKQVHTIESNVEFFNKAKENLKGIDNVVMHFGDSATTIKAALKEIPVNKTVFIFLDAHWGDNNPLLEELKEIKRSNLSCIIAIHDFFNPNHPDYGYDTYGDIVYNYDYIKKDIEEIFINPTILYNTNAIGAKRGVIFIL